MIRFADVTKSYPRTGTALSGVTLHVSKGEFVFLTGPSGAGKSTLLRLLLMQERPSEGQLLVNGQNLSSLSRKKLNSMYL